VPAARYFPHDEPELAARLDAFLASLAVAVVSGGVDGALRVLLLGGGYGRGEGGVFRVAESAPAQLYNDLEFYVVLKDDAPSGGVEAWCRKEAHRGEEQLGIEVEFKVLREGQLRNAQPSLFFLDLLAGHCFVAGDAGFVSTLPDKLRDGSLVPAMEATRLLFNRGTGLFFSAVALDRRDERVGNGFVERNHAKARLALADAVLALNGGHDPSCERRETKVRAGLARVPPGWEQLLAWHTEGVSFKFHPRHANPAPDALLAAQRDLAAAWRTTFLWVESQRLGVPFENARAYAAHTGRVFPETGVVRNLLLHARDRVKHGGALPGWTDYPRAALQRALVLTLDEPWALPGAARCLGLGETSTRDVIHDTYAAWWGRYN
jgi:hypothetical protein